MPTLQLVIKGKVHGVFFRVSARGVANDCGITGWVRNTNEGHVEIIASGNVKQLEQFKAWCKQGPSRARVDQLDVSEIEEQHFDDFTIIR